MSDASKERVGVEQQVPAATLTSSKDVAVTLPPAGGSGSQAPPPAATPVGAASTSFREEYEVVLRKEMEHWPAVPDLEIKFTDLTYELQLPKAKASHSIANVGTAALNSALGPFIMARDAFTKLTGRGESSTVPYQVLKKCSGVLKPGTVTLLITPPGGGKTSFLRALAGRLSGKELSGSVTYSGMTAEEAARRGIQIKQLVQYVDQLDVHLPQLSVRETLEFAYNNSTVDPSYLGHPDLETSVAARVDNVIKLLGLTGCQNTVVGDELLRGVSGGERKRVTIGESMVTNARALMMDEISTGLDSSVTFDIVSSVRSWARITRGTVVIALLQPTPEVYSLFDDVLILRDGGVVYHGPRPTLPSYFQSLGFYPPMPRATSAPVESGAPLQRATSTGENAGGTDIADWLVEMVTHPAATFYSGRVEAGVSPTLSLADGDAVAPADVTTLVINKSATAKPLSPSPNDPITTEALMARWAASSLSQQQLAAPTSTKPLELANTFAQRQYGSPHPRSNMHHFQQLVIRQFRLTSRNKVFVMFRVVASIFIAIVMGTLFYNIPIDRGFDKYGLLLFCATQVSFANFSEVPVAVVNKYVVYKHVSSGMYPSMGYALSAVLSHFPIAFLECTVFSLITYFMCGLAMEAGRFFFFVLVLFLLDIAMAGLFRIFAYGFPDLESAQVAPGPIISIQMLFAGFLITRDKMGWLEFMHYISMFGYGLRSLAQNEFFSEDYSVRVSPGGPTLGEGFLQYFAFQTDPAWKWGGVGFLAGFFVILTLLGGFVLGVVRIERNVGTSRLKEDVEEALVEARKSVEEDATEEVMSPLPETVETDAVTPTAAGVPASLPAPLPVPSKPASHGAAAVTASATQSVLPFQPMTLVFEDVEYRVPIVLNKAAAAAMTPEQRADASIKTLLQGVTGFGKPGTLTALMGASGAGKTTLLDVIAGRKNSGVMKGRILLNGFPKEQRSFARLTAYVEQMDIHDAYSTVLEALEFSAALRLPASVPADQRHAFVREVLELLELTDIADRKIGEVGAADGLSPGQRKRLTIGVELVSNAPILFLDEPTTGLDARAAAVVVRVIKKIADQGRTVITTIHQPSAELFFMMDNLLLLQRGGWQVYFGPVGTHGREVVRYLQAIPGTPRCPRRMNPASWMLDVLAGTDSSGDPAAKHSTHTSPVLSGMSSGEVVHEQLVLGSHHFTINSASRSTLSAAGIAAATVSAEISNVTQRVEEVLDAVVHSMSHSHATGSIATPAELSTVTSPSTTSMGIMRMDSEGHPGPGQLHLPPGAVDPTRGMPTDKSPGVVNYFAILQSTRMWSRTKAQLATLSTPAPGAQPVHFDSLYARNTLFQMYCLLGRVYRSYWRNVGYNYVRLTTLAGLMLLFGVIYYKLDGNSLGGVQSLVSVMFMTTAFIGLTGMNTGLPVQIKSRPVFYRERFSYYYGPEVYAFTNILAELPWILLVCLTSIPIIYFMVGFNPDGGAFFFYALVTFIFSVVFTSIAQFSSALMPSIQIAQAVIGLIIPLLFLFGGLFLREPSIPRGWKWMHIIDPITYALEALVAPQFYCAGPNCPMLNFVDPNTGAQVSVSTYAYVQENFNIDYNNRWADVGYLTIFVAVFQFFHFMAVRFVSHIKR